MLTIIIALGILFGLLIANRYIGNFLAIKMSDQIAALCTSVEYTPEEYEWESNYGDNKWVRQGWVMNTDKLGKGKKDKEWLKTGKSRGRYENSFNRNLYQERMSHIRFYGILSLSSTSAWIADQKAIEKYDPSISEAKIKMLESNIKALEKEAGISE